jgi:hypothetical protein
MSRSNDTLEDDLERMFHRREADVAPPLHLPSALRRNVRARQASRFLAIAVAVGLVTAGSLTANRLFESSSGGTPADNQPAPSYVPPPGDTPSPAPYTVAARGRMAGMQFVLVASGDPAGGNVRTRLRVRQVGRPRRAAVPRQESFIGIRHLDAPLLAIEGAEVDLRDAPGRGWLLWGFWTQGVDRITVSLRGCPPLSVTSGDVVDVGPAGVRMPVWHVATTCGAPTRIHATTIFGGDLGTRTIGRLRHFLI